MKHGLGLFRDSLCKIFRNFLVRARVLGEMRACCTLKDLAHAQILVKVLPFKLHIYTWFAIDFSSDALPVLIYRF